MLCVWAGVVLADAVFPFSDESSKWQAAVFEAQAEAAALPIDSEEYESVANRLSVRLELESPLHWDWCLQDTGPDFRPWLSPSALPGAVRHGAQAALAELGAAGAGQRSELDSLVSQGGRAELSRWLEFYSRIAGLRREIRLRNLRRLYPEWVFTKHHTLGGSHYAYTEGQSDAQHERQFDPGSALCRLDLAPVKPMVHTLLEDADGVIRDPDVSWDGNCVLFAWKQSDREDDYHLYEMDMRSGSVRQLTHGLGFADYEGVYLPNDDILFNSTRCVQTVDCWWTEVSNLYTCSRDGRYLRRLTFDQVHDNYPTVMPDGRVIYTRWEYSDRGQLFVQGLFQMNPDGTGQTEFYGNNSWFPTSLLHARGIPGTTRIVAIFSGHHTRQTGKLGIVDPALGRQENSGSRLIAPVRETPADRIDAYGQEGELFQYPYPISEYEFVVTAAPLGWVRSPTLFKLYWMSADGRRELLAADSELSCSQSVPLAPRPRPPVIASAADCRQDTGTCYLQDVYRGPGLVGVERGTVKKLRVIALDYRAAGIGWNYNAGPAGDALVSTPVSIGNGSWDVKTVLGEATVHPDGSAFFNLPARTPVYFQPVDARGCAVQTMRSWLTLQPGENASCVGCHESKNTVPPATVELSMALKAGPQNLEPFHGPPRGFSFAREVQPILDRHCVGCHHDEQEWRKRLVRAPELDPSHFRPELMTNKVAFSLLGKPVTEDLAKRRWSASYLALVQATEKTLEGNRYLAGVTNALVNWVSAQSGPEMLSPYAAGAASSGLLSVLGACPCGEPLTSAEKETIACWIDIQVPFCGDYQEANQWNGEELAKYQHFLEKRRNAEEIERRNIAELLNASNPSEFVPMSEPVHSTNDAYLSPFALIPSHVGNELYVAGATSREIMVVDRAASVVSRRIHLGASPTGLALAADGQTLFVTSGMGSGEVLTIDLQTGSTRARIPAGHSPVAPVVSPDGNTLFVCDRFGAQLLAIDIPTATTKAHARIGREPVAAAVTPDGRLVLVAKLLHEGPATDGCVAAEVVAACADDLSIADRIRLPNGSTSLRGICVSPDGCYAYVVHTLAHFQFPTTQVLRGWMCASALSIVDIAGLSCLSTVLLDDVDRGAANPWDVVCGADGRWLCVSHSGTHEVSVIDRIGLHRKIASVRAGEFGSDTLAGPQDVSSDLSFLVGLRRRVKLPGNGPRGITVAHRTLYAAEYFTDSLAEVRLGSETSATSLTPPLSQTSGEIAPERCATSPTSSVVRSIPLGPALGPTRARRGEMLFHDADLCYQQWQSCASCHPDARADAMNWDLVNDGLGTPKNTRSLLWSHWTPPAMSLGVRETSATAVRAGIHHIQSMARPEADALAIDAYLESLKSPPSPYLAGNELNDSARRGQGVYEKCGCSECHPAPVYTSLQAYDVGTGLGREKGQAFDTPTLVELWRTAPYLHDGRAATVEEVLTRFNPDDRHGRTSRLSKVELDELVAFLRSL